MKNINKLYIGQIIPNYRQLCKLLCLKIKAGSSKIAQLREMNRYFSYHKVGNAIIIDEIYDNILDKIDGRGGAHNRKEYPNFLIPRENENKIGVYKIVLNYDIYIGSTIVSFRHRFLKHNDDKNNNVPFTSGMLKDGATFEIIEICEEMSEQEIRKIENEYINTYRNDTDWNVINTRESWIPDIQKYKLIKIEVMEQDYQKTLEFLKENNLTIRGAK